MLVIFWQSFLLVSNSFVHLFEPVFCFNLLDPLYEGVLKSLFIVLTPNDSSPTLRLSWPCAPSSTCCEVGFLSYRVVAPGLSVKV